MNENIKKFLEKVEGDKELQVKLSKIKDQDEAYKIASSVQAGFTQEEFVTEMKRLYEEQIKNLSEEDVAKVAGGAVDPVTTVLTVANTVAISVIATSSAAT